MQDDQKLQYKRLWLVINEASGSNDEAAIVALAGACSETGLEIVRRIVFPDDPVPTPAELDAAGIDLLAIFAGDGTVNSLINALAGWDGAVLVLAGGTMNLLHHRLFGELPLEQVIAAVGSQRAKRRRPGIIASPHGHGLAEAMVGPGTAWSNVREAMREGNLIEMAVEASAAVSQTVAGNKIACIDPPVGRAEGYPLLTLEAQDNSLRLIAYYAETAGEYLEQAAAMAARDFRRGPHEVLAEGPAFTLSTLDRDPFGVLLDGEAVEAQGPVRFSLARCEVDLLATRADG